MHSFLFLFLKCKIILSKKGNGNMKKENLKTLDGKKLACTYEMMYKKLKALFN